AEKDATGVEASIDSRGHLNLTSADGRGIQISGTNLSSVTGIGGTNDKDLNMGRLSLTRLDARDIVVSSSTGSTGFGGNGTQGVAEATVNLRDTRGAIDANVASAMGFNANAQTENIGNDKTAGVTTLKGAQAVMNIAETAQKQLDRVRSDLGSVQNQLTSTLDNISVTQVNVKAAESQIRDVDFAAESATFSKHNILAQSGSYAMSQANATQQNVMRLLQ
ncbi:MAG: flagellin, partial [Campylobacterota bacterium]|nr:flagellin [Campylobacterota bacterium]